jgi:broad specificity phosphatase PhoE
MTAHMLLICHAATASTRAAGFPRDDEPIAPEAAERLGALRLRLPAPDRIFVSPAKRARQTAAALGFEARPEPALADCDFGRWRGLSLEEVRRREPQALAEWMQDAAKAPHGGESTLALIARVGAWLESQAPSRGVTLAVTHALVIRAAITAALGAEARAFARIDVGPLTLARLSGHAGRWNLVGLGGAGA